MIIIQTADGKDIYIATTSKVGGPNQKSGLSFGMYYVYLSWDNQETWHKTHYRDQHKLAATISQMYLDDLKAVYAEGY